MSLRFRVFHVLLLAAVSGGTGCGRSSPDAQLAAARGSALAVISAQHPFAGRFSGENAGRVRPFAHASSGLSSANGLEQAAAVERAAGRRFDVTAVSALAVARASIGDLEMAIRLLESCATREPVNASVLNDLAAAYLLRSSAEQRSDDLVRALTFAGRASRLNPGLVEARFNRARALDGLGLAAGRDAWRDYAERDAGSAWGEYAGGRARAAAAGRVIAWDDLRISIDAGTTAPASVDAAAHAQGIREYIDLDLLGRWGREVLAKDRGADSTLVRAQALAERLAGANGDRLSLAGTQAIGGADAAARISLARGHAAWSQGFSLYDQDQREQSRPFFITAVKELRAGNSPMWAWPELQGALLDYHAAQYDEALRRLGAIRTYADAGRFVSLGARARWVEGIILTQQGQLDAALTKMQEARAAFERLGETENVVAIAGTMANSLRILGDAREAWAAVHQALARLDAVRRPVRRYVLLHNGALLAFRMGFDEAAADLSRGAVDYARAGGHPGPIVEALAWLAIMNARLGDLAPAAASIREAEQLMPQITDATLQTSLAADIAYAQSAALERSSPREALAAAGTAIDELSRSNPPIAFNVLPIKVRSALATAQPGLARQTLTAGISMFEQRLQKLPVERFRISYFDSAWELYTSAARLELDTHHDDAAFRYFERGRSRVLLEALTKADDVPTLGSLGAAIPANVTVVAYTSLDEELITWVLSSREHTLYRQPVTKPSLDAEVESYIARSQTVEAGTAGTLERIVLEPWLNRVPPGSTIAFVPDGSLHRLALAGLRSGQGQFLIERNAIAVIPSVSTYLALAHNRAFARSRGPKSALLVNAGQVNDPSHRLPNLPSVDGEIREAQRAYASSFVLSGADATPERLTAVADGYDVVHFGGHAVANDEFPLASALVLPGGKRLTIEQLGHLSWHRVSIVVLAACSTARGPIWRGEGVVSLARPFLAAGVPTVAATLADVDDRISGRVFAIFHREIGRGASPAEALRVAQTTLLKTGTAQERAVSAWAPFVVIGVP